MITIIIFSLGFGVWCIYGLIRIIIYRRKKNCKKCYFYLKSRVTNKTYCCKFNQQTDKNNKCDYWKVQK